MMNPDVMKDMVEAGRHLGDRAERSFERYRKAGLSLAVWLAAIAGSELWWQASLKVESGLVSSWVTYTALLVIAVAFLCQLAHYIGSMYEARSTHQRQLELVELANGRRGGEQHVKVSGEAARLWKAGNRLFSIADKVVIVASAAAVLNIGAVGFLIWRWRRAA